jgi:hypothetical protein
MGRHVPLLYLVGSVRVDLSARRDSSFGKASHEIAAADSAGTVAAIRFGDSRGLYCRTGNGWRGESPMLKMNVLAPGLGGFFAGETDVAMRAR